MFDVLILPGLPSDMNLDYGPGIVRACAPAVSRRIRIEAGGEPLLAHLSSTSRKDRKVPRSRCRETADYNSPEVPSIPTELSLPPPPPTIPFLSPPIRQRHVANDTE